MNKKRRHHHVWKHYLSAWNSSDKLWCARQGKIFKVGTEDIANIRDFYKLKKMNKNELVFTQKLCQLGDKGMSEINKYWPELFDLVHKIKESLQSEDALKEAELLIHNAYEDLHSHIEGFSIKYLKELKEGNTSFFEDPDSQIEFVFYLMMQYVRTNKMKQQVIGSFEGEEKLKNREINIENIWGPLQLCVATNVAHSIILDDYKLIMLNAAGNEKFITGDQPVINFDSSTDIEGESNTFELFYPISPDKAILLVKEQKNAAKDWSRITDNEINHLNQLIKEESLEQIYSHSKECLEAVIS